MIVIVSGLPRSGTSLVMQMLAAGGLPAFTDGRRAADDSNPRGYLEHDRVRGLARDASWLAEADGHALKVVAPLLPHLPAGHQFRVILVTRAMEEVIASQAEMLRRAGTAPARSEALIPTYDRQLVAARHWAASSADGLLEIDHSALVTAPRESAERLARFTGLALNIGAMTAVVDPALHRQKLRDHG